MPKKEQEKTSNEVVDDAVKAIIEQWPVIIEKLVSELEILTGKKLKGIPKNVAPKTFCRKLRNLMMASKQLEIVGSEQPTPKWAAEILLLINRIIRLIAPRTPRNKEPIEYLIQEVQRQSEIPVRLVLPQGVDYEKKHTGMQAFICELVDSVNEAEIDTFLREAFTGRHLISQFQRALNKISLPKDLQRFPSKLSVRSIEKIKLALRDVTADWDALLNLLYGLVLLKQGKKCTWASLRKVSLWDKVLCVGADYRLTVLAKQEWVTVRNSLDHGSAFFDPNRECIEFRDRTRSVSWRVDHAFLEGIDIHLANSAMLLTQNFVQAARIKSIKSFVMALKNFSQQ